MKILHLFLIVSALAMAVTGHAGDILTDGGEIVPLRPCPESPNCVSSLSTDSQHKITPLRVTGDPDAAIRGLAAIVGGMKRSTIIRQDAESLAVEFRTLLGFVDDAEFVLSRDEEVIHVRSASRTGYWDLGVNRKRVEQIREQFGRLR